MGVNEWVTELDMEVHESQNERDKRVEDLWKQLDVHAAGYLDLKGLQKGLRRIDHRESLILANNCCFNLVGTDKAKQL
jgi:solute carrier family 25 phosphate transporter 23/24/25/41